MPNVITIGEVLVEVMHPTARQPPDLTGEFLYRTSIIPVEVVDIVGTGGITS
jgi:hypothetical protein